MNILEKFGTFEQKVGEFDPKSPENEPENGENRYSGAKSDTNKSQSQDGESSVLKQDFEESFNPGFKSIGTFGGQSSASGLWGQRKF